MQFGHTTSRVARVGFLDHLKVKPPDNSCEKSSIMRFITN